MNRREFLTLFAKAAVVAAAVPTLANAKAPSETTGFISVDEYTNAHLLTGEFGRVDGPLRLIESNQYGDYITVPIEVSYQESLKVLGEIEASMKSYIPKSHWDRVTYLESTLGELQSIAWKYTP